MALLGRLTIQNTCMALVDILARTIGCLLKSVRQETLKQVY